MALEDKLGVMDEFLMAECAQTIEYAATLCSSGGWLWSRPLAHVNVCAAMENVETCLGMQSPIDNDIDGESSMLQLNRILLDKLTLFRQLGKSDMNAYLLQCELDPELLRIGNECIGSGRFGKVLRATYDGKLVAVKKIPISEDGEIEAARREVFMLQKLYPCPVRNSRKITRSTLLKSKGLCLLETISPWLWHWQRTHCLVSFL
jgi:hypothetical protein